MCAKRNELGDLLYEGRDKVYVDEDRMVAEGLAGGTVHRREGNPNIGEYHDFPQEEPPHKVDEE